MPAAQGHGSEVCGGSSTNPVFWVAVALTGVATGLPGHPMTVIRFGRQHLPFGYYAGSLQPGSGMPQPSGG